MFISDWYQIKLGTSVLSTGGAMHTKGRRSDIDTNAFWAAAAALVPVTAREDKKVRSVMRVLGLRYESVKRAIEIRKAMVERCLLSPRG